MFFSRDNHVFEIVGVYRGTRQRFRKDSFARSHSSIGMRLSGKSEIKCDKRLFSVEENQLLYIPSMVKYSQRSTYEEFISVCFIEHGEASRTIELLSLPETGRIREELIRLHSIWSEGGRGYRLECQAILYSILHDAYLMSSEADGKHTRAYEIIRPAMEHIYANYKFGGIRIAALAKLCYISETYFRRLFKEIFGVSPQAFINTLRIDTAASILESGDFSVGDAAAAAGFSDAKYFSREFKKAKGVSPTSYLTKKPSKGSEF